MSRELNFHPAIRKDLHKITPQARATLLSLIFPAIAENPAIGIALTGPLKGFYKHRVFLFRVWYRIAYQISKDRGEVTIIAVGSRGGFYDRLRRRLRI